MGEGEAVGAYFEALEPRQLLDAVAWTGGAGDSLWQTAGNWWNSTQGVAAVPTISDDVVIEGGASSPILFPTAAGSRGVRSLVVRSDLAISGGVLSVAESVVIDGATVTLTVGRIEGGSWSWMNGGALSPLPGEVSLAPTLSGVTIESDMLVRNTPIRIENGLTLNAVITLRAEGSPWMTSELRFEPGVQTLEGSGEVVLTNTNGWMSTVGLGYGGATSLTIAPGVTIRGNGRIYQSEPSTIINQGAIRATLAWQLLTVDVTSFVNEGVASAGPGPLMIVGAWVNAAGGVVEAMGAGVTLGYGEHAWVNHGTINAVDGTVLLRGVMTQAAIGTLNVDNSSVLIGGTIQGGLTLNAATGPWHLAYQGTIEGGTLNILDGLVMEVRSTGTVLSGVTVNGNIHVLDYSTLGAINGLTLNGSIRVTSLGSHATLALGWQPQTISGNGEIILETMVFSYEGARVTMGASNRTTAITIGPGITIRGSGSVRAIPYGNVTLTNHGEIRATHDGWTMHIVAPTVRNHGTIGAHDGGTLNLDSGWINDGGTLEVDGGIMNLGGTFSVFGFNAGSFVRNGGTVNVTGVLQGTTGQQLTLSAAGTGAWNILPGGSINSATVVLEDVPLYGKGGRIAGASITGDIIVPDGQTLILSTLYLYGTLTLASTGSYTEARLYDTTNSNQRIWGNGEVILQGDSAIDLAYGALEIGAQITIRGIGRIGRSYGGGSSITNLGTIIAEGAGGVLSVTHTLVQRGTLRIEPGVTLRLSGVTIGTQQTPGIVVLNEGVLDLYGSATTTSLNVAAMQRTGGMINIYGSLGLAGGAFAFGPATGVWTMHPGSTITAGRLDPGNGTLVVLGGTLSNITLEGDLTINDGIEVMATNLTLAANITVSGMTSVTQLRITGSSQTIGGTGEIRLMPAGEYSRLFVTASSATIAVGVIVRGAGAIQGFSTTTVINRGQIIADVAGETLLIRPGTFNNLGVLNVEGGDVGLGPNTNLSNFSGGTLTGGTWIITGGSLDIGPRQVLVNAAEVRIGPAGGFAALETLATNNGQLMLLGGQGFAVSGNFTNHGMLRVSAGSTLTVAGDFVQGSMGTLWLEIADAAGRVEVGGQAQLGGMLRVTIDMAAAPQTSFVVGGLLTAQGISGSFGSVVIEFDAQHQATVAYNGWGSGSELLLRISWRGEMGSRR